MNIITKQQAIENNLKYYFTNKPCKKGHIDLRYVVSSDCLSCAKKRNKKRLKDDPNYYSEWVSKNREKVNDYHRQYYHNNPEYKTQNTANTAKRKAMKLQATPIWADFDKIDEMYTLSRDLTNETGVIHHVDHIIPLQSDIVCGLHVHHNLQVITASENKSKSNKLLEFQPN